MKLIIINQSQFGNHTDTFYHCKYLRYDIAIVSICWDYGLPKIEMNGVQVVYASRKGNVLARTI